MDSPRSSPVIQHHYEAPSLRVPADFISIALGESISLFEEKHGVKITTIPADDGASNELRINPSVESSFESRNAMKEVENVSLLVNKSDTALTEL